MTRRKRSMAATRGKKKAKPQVVSTTTNGCDCGKPCEEDTTPLEEEQQQQAEDAQEGMEKIVFVNDSSRLNVIQTETVQLAVWRQTSIPTYDALLQHPSVDPSSLPAFEDLVTPHDAYEKMKRYLNPPYPLRSKSKRCLSDQAMEELLREIDELVQVFAEICQSPFVFVKLHVLQDDGCRFWHQDCVDYRLVKTYRGPCTEWVPPAYSKATLRTFQEDSPRAKSLSHRDVALFKGQGELLEDEGDEDFLNRPGIVHRSPRWNGECRLVLVLDEPQEGWHF